MVIGFPGKEVMRSQLIMAVLASATCHKLSQALDICICAVKTPAAGLTPVDMDGAQLLHTESAWAG